MYIYFAYFYEVLYTNYIIWCLYKSPGVNFKHMDVSYVSSIYNNGKNKCWNKNGKISVYLPLPGVTVLKNVMENLSEHTIKKNTEHIHGYLDACKRLDLPHGLCPIRLGFVRCKQGFQKIILYFRDIDWIFENGGIKKWQNRFQMPHMPVAL